MGHSARLYYHDQWQSPLIIAIYRRFQLHISITSGTEKHTLPSILILPSSNGFKLNEILEGWIGKVRYLIIKCFNHTFIKNSRFEVDILLRRDRSVVMANSPAAISTPPVMAPEAYSFPFYSLLVDTTRHLSPLHLELNSWFLFSRTDLTTNYPDQRYSKWIYATYLGLGSMFPILAFCCFLLMMYDCSSPRVLLSK